MDFIQWVIDNNDDANDEEEFDDLLLEFIHDLHASGGTKGRASMAYYGIVNYMPELKHKLVRSKQALRGWNKRHQGQSYPPMTWELAIACAVQLARGKSHLALRYAAGVLTQFDCLLRVSELVALEREDIADSADLRISGEHRGMIIRLRKTKNGVNQTVQVLDPHVVELLRHLIAITKPGQRLFPFSADQYRRALKHVCAELGLSSLYVTHSLRHGGATRYHHVLGMSMEDVLRRGRWMSNQSARRYIQEGRALLMAMSAPRHIMELGVKMSSNISLFISLAQKH